MPRLTQYNYVFAIGTFFALLDAYNNGASKYLFSTAPSPEQ
jgi:sodium-dependent phosphate transporter